MFLKFKYTNWRGDEHIYVILVTDAETSPDLADPGRSPIPFLNGNVITRDDDPRNDMDHRRRSFRIVKMRELEEVPEPTE